MARLLLIAALGCGFTFAGTGCRFSTGVPSRGGTHYEHQTESVPVYRLADLWVSYQIAVVEVDGKPTSYAPDDKGVYYRITLAPGEHTLAVRLDYRTPTMKVKSTDLVRKLVSLKPGRAYRLLDLGAGMQGERSFTPWVLEAHPRKT